MLLWGPRSLNGSPRLPKQGKDWFLAIAPVVKDGNFLQDRQAQSYYYFMTLVANPALSFANRSLSRMFTSGLCRLWRELSLCESATYAR